MTKRYERRKIRAAFKKAESCPELTAMREAISNPIAIKSIKHNLGDALAKFHHEGLEELSRLEFERLLADADRKEALKHKLAQTSTESITENEFLVMIGRGDKSQQANSSWILRQIEAANNDPSAFPPYIQVGRKRRYHVDSVKAWLLNLNK